MKRHIKTLNIVVGSLSVDSIMAAYTKKFVDELQSIEWHVDKLIKVPQGASPSHYEVEEIEVREVLEIAYEEMGFRTFEMKAMATLVSQGLEGVRIWVEGNSPMNVIAADLLASHANKMGVSVLYEPNPSDAATTRIPKDPDYAEWVWIEGMVSKTHPRLRDYDEAGPKAVMYRGGNPITVARLAGSNKVSKILLEYEGKAYLYSTAGKGVKEIYVRTW